MPLVGLFQGTRKASDSAPSSIYLHNPCGNRANVDDQLVVKSSFEGFNPRWHWGRTLHSLTSPGWPQTRNFIVPWGQGPYSGRGRRWVVGKSEYPLPRSEARAYSARGSVCLTQEGVWAFHLPQRPTQCMFQKRNSPVFMPSISTLHAILIGHKPMCHPTTEILSANKM